MKLQLPRLNDIWNFPSLYSSSKVTNLDEKNILLERYYTKYSLEYFYYWVQKLGAKRL